MEINKNQKLKIKIKSEDANSELYSFLNFLNETKFFGEVTLYFQNGNVEFIHQKVSLTKSDIKKIIKRIEIQKNASKANASLGINESQSILPLIIPNNKNEVIK